MMNQNNGSFDPSLNKNIIKALIIFIAILVAISGIVLWQKKHKVKPVDQGSQLNLQVENDSQNPGNSEKSKEDASNKVSILSFSNLQKPVKTGEEFSVDAVIDPKGKEITAAELHITFDPNILELENINGSDMFSLELSKANVDNDKGTASIILGAKMGKPATEISTIATFKFKTILASGNTEIVFSDQTKAAAKGQSTNVLASSSPVIISIQK